MTTKFDFGSNIRDINANRFLHRQHEEHLRRTLISFRKVLRAGGKVKSFGDLMAGSGSSYEMAKQVWKLRYVWLNDLDLEAVRKLKENYPTVQRITDLNFLVDLGDVPQIDYYHVDFNTFTLLQLRKTENALILPNLQKLYQRSTWLGVTDTACHMWHINCRRHGLTNLDDYYIRVSEAVTGNGDNLFSVQVHGNAAYLVLKH